ncbi:MAG: hypothetical protein JNL52_10875 [Flavobacteriales bacterium]|nr:hypothetical protein [Flavobacteriales bacterium]
MEKGGLLVGNDQVLGVAFSSSGSFQFVHLHRTRREVRLLRMGNAADANDLARQCGTRVPVALALDGPRTVHRVVPTAGSVQSMLTSAFPHAPLDQLLVDGRTFGSGTGLSMLRAADAHGTLAELRGGGFRIVHLSIGPWHLLPLRELLSDPADPWPCAGHRFQLSGPDLLTHARDTDSSASVVLGGDTLPSDTVPAYAVAWDHLVPGTHRSLFPEQGLSADRQQERARIWYERGLMAVVAVLLFLLGTDQVLRSMAGPQPFTDARALQLAEHAVDSLQDQLTEQRQLLAGTMLAEDRSPVRQLAALVTHVPASIELDRAWASPLLAPLREREEPRLDHGRIRVEGRCDDPKVLNGWMQHLRGRYPGRDVQLVALVPGERGSRPQFTLVIAP